MDRIVSIMLAVAALAIAGCTEKPNAHPVHAAQGAGESGGMQPSPAHGGAGQTANPHAAVNPMEMNVGADHRGKVVSTLNAVGYTYIEIEEDGKKIWVAATQVEVKPGDEVAFPDSPPVETFRRLGPSLRDHMGPEKPLDGLRLAEESRAKGKKIV